MASKKKAIANKTKKKPKAKKTTAKKTTAKKTSAKKTSAKAKAPKVAPKDPPGPKEGDVAPAFSLPGDDGQMHALADHRGQDVVVYFYPRDDTPGCTVEACDFRDNMARVAAKGAVVYGVSKDSMASHDKFKSKFGLNFTLLSDEDKAVHTKYGAWGEKVLYGQKMIGVIRSTFWIGPDGTIKQAWRRVKTDGHVDAVLQAMGA